MKKAILTVLVSSLLGTVAQAQYSRNQYTFCKLQHRIDGVHTSEDFMLVVGGAVFQRKVQTSEGLFELKAYALDGIVVSVDWQMENAGSGFATGTLKYARAQYRTSSDKNIFTVNCGGALL